MTETSSMERVMVPAGVRLARILVAAYLIVSCAAVAAVALLASTAPQTVNPQAWVRSIIVAATSILTLRFASGAVKGRPRALLRLRIVLTVLFVAVAGVLAFLPLPAWMIAEQAVCGALLLGAAIAAFSAK
jgi:hypothetical protein